MKAGGNKEAAGETKLVAEKLYNKLVRDCLHKIITDSSLSTSSSSLPLLPQSNGEQQSHAFQKPTAATKNLH
jgi:hypothetical protein